jgi:predicted ribosome quality control (RQC) complex YloA/Tae2 family protein
VSLRPSELAAIAAELHEHLVGAVVQKVNATQPGRLWLELRIPGRSVTLHCCAAPQVGRLSVVENRPKGTPGEASGFQHLSRQRLTGARLTGVTHALQRVQLELLADETPLTLVLELSAPPVLLLTAGERILAVSAAAPVPERPGAPLVFRPSSAPAGTSRLSAHAPSAELTLARAAESLFAKEESARALEAARAPLLTRLARLSRTRKKVEAEAARTGLAARHRRDGELLKQHLAQIPRGAREVTLTEYLPDGTIAERTVALEPSRTPQQHAEWLFHQYRRLTRGAQLSLKRLEQLDKDRAALELQLQALTGAPPPPLAPVRRRAHEPTARPYREYTAAHGERIWVGKGSLDNDTLTFKLSRPHDLWLHARGVPGAHVVIPLERGATAPQEVLLDAAHLALHHSDLKGEPRGEVSYVPVKYLRKVKGAPGAVTFSQEKTFVLRVEPARLARLLASEQKDA